MEKLKMFSLIFLQNEHISNTIEIEDVCKIKVIRIDFEIAIRKLAI